MSPLSHKLVLTKPCQSDWNSMTMAGDGRHCKSCDKIVIDFSTLKDDEITAFFLKNNNSPVCGRFYQSQIARIRIYLPSYVFNKPITNWKRFLLIFLICFGSNLYPFDFITGNHPSLYAQSFGNKQTGSKKQYKLSKKKLKRIRIYDLIKEFPTESMIMGFTRMTPSTATVQIQHIPRINIRSTKTSTVHLPAKIEIESETGKQDKTPNKPGSKTNIEYILPATIKYRRKRRPSK